MPTMLIAQLRERRFHLPNRLLNAENGGLTRWGNLGYWSHTQSYSQAGQELAQKLGQLARLNPTDSLLDVSIGQGDQLKLWHDLFGIKHIIGLDITAHNLAVAHPRLQSWQLEAHVQLMLGSATQLDFLPKHTFNKIISLDSAYHYAPRHHFFEQAARLLEPGGKLALSDLALSEKKTSFPKYGSWSPLFFQFFGPLALIPPQNWLTPGQYRQQLVAYGFERIQIQPIDEAVFSGFAQFMGRHVRQYIWCWPFAAWPKLLATAALCRWVVKHKSLHYLLISADRTTGSSTSTR